MDACRHCASHSGVRLDVLLHVTVVVLMMMMMVVMMRMLMVVVVVLVIVVVEGGFSLRRVLVWRFLLTV